MRILFCILLLVLVELKAATPAFTDFDLNQFGTNGHVVVIKSGATITNLAISGTLTADELDVATIVTTNGMAFSDTLVANLGAPAAGTYPIKFSTDVLTAYGSGDVVRWDGTGWRTGEYVLATADTNQFILNAAAICLNKISPISVIMFQRNSLSTLLGFPRATLSAGTGAISSVQGWDTYEIINRICAGTTTNGASMLYGMSHDVTVAGDKVACGGQFSTSVLASDTDIYWASTGFESVAANSLSAAVACFLYDPYNITTRGITTSGSNNWVAVSGNASAYTSVDTGLPYSLYTTRARLMVIHSSTQDVFYTNGVPAVTNVANLSTVDMYGNVSRMVKWSGTTSINFYEQSPFVHTRRWTARNAP